MVLPKTNLPNGDRRDERGHVVLVTLVIVLAVAALGLGINILLRSRVDQEFQLRTIGEVPTQARYVAEIGINQLIFNLNAGYADLSACTDASPCNFSSGSGDVFPDPALQNPTYAGSYTLKVTDLPVRWTVVAKGRLSGSLVDHTRTVAVSVLGPDANNLRWRAGSGSWKELP